MGESFDHRPPGWIRQSGKRCTQLIHNHMVVDYRVMSSAEFWSSRFVFMIRALVALSACEVYPVAGAGTGYFGQSGSTMYTESQGLLRLWE